MLAGWTLTDIGHAIDHRPDGTMWAHDGATGVTQIGRWLSHRLAPWHDEHGTVRRSPSQQLAAEAVRARAAAAARDAARAAQMADRSQPDSPAVVAALKQIRATVERARTEHRHQQSRVRGLR